MKALRPLRWLLPLIFAAALIPVASRAEVVISVGFAPPPLLVYDQPPCPDQGLIWTPGYWAYGPDGYYWVPGAWVPAPFEGALWTPGYWGWDGGMYYWHPGYWGRHVGYYGGVNYGFGYFGIGFLGGRWNGGFFEYNTAVWHVNREYIRRTYEDRDWDRHYVDRDSHVAFAGGPGGIRHDPDSQERAYMHEQHYQRTNFQTQHIEAARQDHNAYYNVNHGRPNTVVASHPLGRDNGSAERNGYTNNPRGGNPAAVNGGARNGYEHNRGGQNPTYEGNRENQTARPQQPQMHTQPEYRNVPQQHQAEPQPHSQPESRQAPPQPQQRERQQPQYRAQPEYRQVPRERQQQHQEPQYRQPEQQPQGRPQQEARPQQRPENHGNGGGHAEHEDHGHDK